MFAKQMRRALRSLGIGAYRLSRNYAEDGLVSAHAGGFREDARFRDAYARGVQASGGVDPQFAWRIHVALWVAETGLRAEGDFVECGVNAGFCSSAILHYLDWNRQGRRFFLIDTFAGPVLEQFTAEESQAGRMEVAKAAIAAGAYVTDLERVRANFAEWPSVVVLPGAVPDVLPMAPVEKLAFLHIDMNCAAPEVAALEYFWDRLSVGAGVLLDDYAYVGHECQRRAMDEAARRLGRSVLALPTGQGFLLR
jgi:hypothetical protein